MKSKKGYKEQKGKLSTGRWLDRYFEKKTCGKSEEVEKEIRGRLKYVKMLDEAWN